MTWHMFYSHRWVQFGGTGVSEMMWKLCRQTKKPKAFRFLDAKCWIWAVFSWNRKSNQDVSKHFFNLIHMTGWFLGMSWTTKCCAVDQHPIVNFHKRSQRLMPGIYMRILNFQDLLCMVYVCIYRWDAFLISFDLGHGLNPFNKLSG